LAVFLDVPESIAYSRPHERKVRLRPFAVGVNRNLFYCEPGTWCDWISYDAAKFAFSMVILQTHIAVLWFAVGRRYRGYSGGDAILAVVLIVAISEILIWGATIFSYLTGVNTYFEDPVAVAGTADAVSFASAMVARAGGLVANCVLAAILGAIGSATAVLIPAEKI